MTAPASLSAQLPRPGDMIAGKYVLDRLLGQGGMGAVFAARHIKLSKAVAIKIMLADSNNVEAAQRFVNEGKAAANIQNEHVVAVYDVDEEMGYAYMVLELLEGEDLAQVLEREPTHRLPPHIAVGYVVEALKGVTQAHAIGIVHRDLKPSNLFLAKRKDGTIVTKVLDFGISKAQGSSALAASPNALTSTKAMLGSPLYMSPEQLRSSKSVDHRADIWAIGVILYELITGALPFMGDNLGELFAAILETDPTPLRQRVDGVPAGLEEVVLRCLARRPENRFNTASELMSALQPFTSPQAGVTGYAQTNQMSHAGQTAMVTHPNQHQSNPHGSLGQMTPGGMVRPTPPQPGAVTSGSGPRPVVAGTAPLGAVTPQGLRQTGSGWQSTGSGQAAIPKSKAPLFAAIGGLSFLVIVGLVLIGLYVKSSKKPDPLTATSGNPPASVATNIPDPPPTPSLTVPTPPTATATATETAATSASVAPTSTAAATSTAVAKTTPTGHKVPPPPTPPTNTNTAKVDPKPPATPDPTPAKKPPTPPTPTNTNGGLQNAR